MLLNPRLLVASVILASFICGTYLSNIPIADAASKIEAGKKQKTEKANSLKPIAAEEYLWLEEVEGKKALDWARKFNSTTTKALEASPDFEPMRKRLLEIMDSKDQIPDVTKYGKYYYNFWRDDKNVRGLWRRTSLEEYKKAQPTWETVLDVDKLAKDEKENWVWHGADVLNPDYDLSLISLSRGGKDADVVREFDLTKKEFVKDGFKLPEAKSNVTWRNRDALYVGTDFGAGSLTDSGYPRIVKEWKRGTPLTTAVQVFEGKPADVSVSASVSHDHGKIYEIIQRGLTFFTNETRVKKGDAWVLIEKPDDAEFSTFGDYALITLRSDWKVGDKTYKAGSLLAENFDAYLKGERKFDVLFAPPENGRVSLASVDDTKNYLILNELDNVRSRIYVLRNENGAWKRTAIEAPTLSSIHAWGIDADESDDYFVKINDYLTPASLYLSNAEKTGREKIKSTPEFFKAGDLQIQQFEATSKDGTKVPYFQVSKKDVKLDGTNPTLLYGYGGFEISLTPNYRALTGAGWLEKGGVYIDANIRGGGEFGPGWHNAARKENRQRAYEDFIAVAEDLIARKVTSPKHLGIKGGSNGGLLMGVMLTQRPDLWGAVVCGSPLLDMRRYHKLLAGASWMDEYGDPDKEENWAFISKYSPFQNIKAGQKYPPILITTSTKDDRVHPGHARRFAARLQELKYPVQYYENIEGGHSAASDNKQQAYLNALDYVFLWNKLK